MHTLLPEPFRFMPHNSTVMGAAFSLPFKVLATLIVGSCSIWFLQLWARGAWGPTAGTGTYWFLAGLGLMVWTWWNILVSQTRMDGQGLHQSWVWNKAMLYQDLAYVRLIHVRGFDWLIAPRLYVRALNGKFTVFYGATPALLAEFERISTHSRAFHRFPLR